MSSTTTVVKLKPDKQGAHDDNRAVQFEVGHVTPSSSALTFFNYSSDFTASYEQQSLSILPLN